MKSKCIAAAMSLAALFSLPVAAQVCQGVAVSPVSDAAPGRWIDPAATQLDGSQLKLNIGFATGLDAVLWKYNEFTASTNAFYYASVADTIRFLVQAPTGCYISRVAYTQRGVSSISRIGRTAGSTSWVVGDKVASIVFGSTPTQTLAMDLPLPQDDRPLPIAISVGLFAFSTPSIGSATISLSGADVTFELKAK
jgi:hypothetical protein